MRFLPHTEDDVREMLETIGVGSIDQLFADIPASLRASAAIDLPAGRGEPDVVRITGALAARNDARGQLSFLGGGAYPHHVPAVVDQILQRAEFYSAYTPYQPEVSQGTLQAIYEFQTMVSMLCGLEVANASMYDGATATAEAVLMALRVRRDGARRVILARSLHPQYREVTRTYLGGAGEVEVLEAPFAPDGRLDLDWLATHLGDATAAVVVGYPNFFGVIEDVAAIAERIRDSGALLVTATGEALALGLLKPPGELGADIAVAEGQSLGVPLQYGGPGVGLFASRDRYVRSMPGRLVGQAVDVDGRTGFVLTLATREQHIRRERATSNICTNHGLMALAVTVYLSLLGKQGLRRLAEVNASRAHRACRLLCRNGCWKPAFAAPFFNEFVLRGENVDAALAEARAKGVLAGLPLGRWYPELDDALLVAVTEVHDAEAVERLADSLA